MLDEVGVFYFYIVFLVFFFLFDFKVQNCYVNEDNEKLWFIFYVKIYFSDNIIIFVVLGKEEKEMIVI